MHQKQRKNNQRAKLKLTFTSLVSTNSAVVRKYLTIVVQNYQIKKRKKKHLQIEQSQFFAF